MHGLELSAVGASGVVLGKFISISLLHLDAPAKFRPKKKKYGNISSGLNTHSRQMSDVPKVSTRLHMTLEIICSKSKC